MASTTLQLEKLTCPSCMQKIKKNVEVLDGVIEAKILFDASKARVFFDNQKISPKMIIQKIEAIGYTAEEIQ